MQWSDIQFDPPLKTLRGFAALWLLFFTGLACWQGFVRGRVVVAAILLIMALTIGPAGLLRPRLVRPIYVAWMVLAFPIGWTVSLVILAVIFYGIFTPVALIFRLIGRDVLSRAARPDRDTYWTPKPAPASVRSYFDQF
jgi:hypothetical protein